MEKPGETIGWFPRRFIWKKQNLSLKVLNTILTRSYRKGRRTSGTGASVAEQTTLLGDYEVESNTFVEYKVILPKRLESEIITFLSIATLSRTCLSFM